MMLKVCFSNSLLFLAFFVVSGCDTSYTEKKIIFIGDSLVAGWDIEYYFPFFNLTNKGVDGATISDINVEINPAYSPKSTLIVLVGTNDIARNTDKISNSEFYDNIVSELKNKILNSHTSHTVIISILPRSDFNAKLINIGIIELNSRLSNLVNEIPNAVFLNVYSLFSDRNGLLNINYSADGVHINSFGYALLSSKLSSFL